MPHWKNIQRQIGYAFKDLLCKVLGHDAAKVNAYRDDLFLCKRCNTLFMVKK